MRLSPEDEDRYRAIQLEEERVEQEQRAAREKVLSVGNRKTRRRLAAQARKNGQ